MATIFIPAQMKDLTGGTVRFETDAETVRDAIAELEQRFAGIKERLCEGEELSSSLNVAIDHEISSQGLHAKVSPNSEIHFIPAIGGGA